MAISQCTDSPIAIQLGHGLVAVVDAADADLRDLKWSVLAVGYAYRRGRRGRKRTTEYLHRVIMARVLGRQLLTHELVDHINRIKQDCRRSNLRLATPPQNAANTVLRRNNTSGYKGVHWDRERSKWAAQIRIHQKKTNLGRFDTPEEAYDAYCKAAKAAFGEFCRLD